MTTDQDVFRSAILIVQQHGAEAPIEAAMRADAMLDRGDLDGQRVWLRILRAHCFSSWSVGGRASALDALHCN